MATFGELLKREREDHGLTIQAVADRIGGAPAILEALERNDFAALPGEAEMDACLHAYADCLDVDAELMIADYVKERDRRRAVPEKPAPAPAAAPLAGSTQRRARVLPWPVAVVGLALLLLGVWWALSAGRDESTASAPGSDASTGVVAAASAIESTSVSSGEEAPAAEAERTGDPAEPRSTPVAEQAEPAATRVEASPGEVELEAEPRAMATREPSAVRGRPQAGLRIGDFGVGDGVENRDLVNRSERFRAGTQAWFWTRVVGATSGTQIDHVWLRDGREVQRRTLRIGSSNWRTYSAVVLPGDALGEWTVEARDSDGRVLARSEFTCVR